MSRKIKTLLIANRGEIACRVAATARAMGIRTVAVYSDADRDALHVKSCDDAIHIGPAQASESYLQADKIIAAAKAAGADAVHPGYGFLSENPDFARALANAEIVFVGPPAMAMEAMALKGKAKALMTDANVPVVPGYHGDDQSTATLTREADRIGYPLLIKAVAGGGGKGMRRVESENEFDSALQSAQNEGRASFGNADVLLEKLIVRPRHIEIQVFADNAGNAVHLWERDCSIQRRHQKVLEEAPAPDMPAALRKAMGDAAVRAAEAIGYSGAGTVEFIVDASKPLADADFYFMEMNTRLQVEHPVTEMISGLDLVEWQLLVAEGHALPLGQDDIDQMMQGHAVEARLYAEDAFGGFLPATGRVGLFDPFRPLGPTQRIDSGVTSGDSVTTYYDPMIAKMIAHGDTREAAIDALIDLLGESPVAGLTHNRDFLIRLADHPGFRSGDVHTGFIAEHEDALVTPHAVLPEDLALAALALINARGNNRQAPLAHDAFQLNLPKRETILLTTDGDSRTVIVDHQRDQLMVFVGEKHFTATIRPDSSPAELVTSLDGRLHRRAVHLEDTTITLVDAARTISIGLPRRADSTADALDGPGSVQAPMPGKVIKIYVANGDTVETGEPLLVMEAMKMEQTLTAPRAGTVDGLGVSTGEQIADGALLLTILDEEAGNV